VKNDNKNKVISYDTQTHIRTSRLNARNTREPIQINRTINNKILLRSSLYFLWEQLCMQLN